MLSLTNLAKALLSIAIIIFFAIGCQTGSQKTNPDQYIENIQKERNKKDIELVDTATSRFNEDERTHFAVKGLQYFPPDINYYVDAEFIVDTSTPAFQMATTTDRKPNYRIYGYLDFILKDTACRLTVFQNVDIKDHPEHGKFLFIPFMDNTNEFTTYGAGRYIDILIPSASQIQLDFNNAYNPYCAYADRWSCPLVPFDNHLDVSIFAGEKKYK